MNFLPRGRSWGLLLGWCAATYLAAVLHNILYACMVMCTLSASGDEVRALLGISLLHVVLAVEVCCYLAMSDSVSCV